MQLQHNLQCLYKWYYKEKLSQSHSWQEYEFWSFEKMVELVLNWTSLTQILLQYVAHLTSPQLCFYIIHYFDCGTLLSGNCCTRTDLFIHIYQKLWKDFDFTHFLITPYFFLSEASLLYVLFKKAKDIRTTGIFVLGWMDKLQCLVVDKWYHNYKNMIGIIVYTLYVCIHTDFKNR